MNYSAVLSDIEGTTTSISFVLDILFPLSSKEMENFVDANWGKELLEPLRMEINPFTRETVTQTLREWIAANVKPTVLKSIQGIIWKSAYEKGEVKSHVYPDVPVKFAEWKRLGIPIAIFSSGSVQAQQLLFRYTEAGNLEPFISAYFDTTTGPKQDAASYSRIAELLKRPAGEILFLSDIKGELDAAHASGMQTYQLLREGTEAAGNHPIVTSFLELPQPS